MRIHPFRDGDVHPTFRNIVEKTVREIEALESDYVLKASLVELEEYYASRVRITPLALSAKDHYIDGQEGTQIDVSHDIKDRISMVTLCGDIAQARLLEEPTQQGWRPL